MRLSDWAEFNDMQHYHDYQKVSESIDGIVEICRECRKRLITKKGKDERIDNVKYLKEHARDFAQPTGRTSRLFRRFYGKPKT